MSKKWLLFVFLDKERTDLFKVMDFNTIKEVSYILGETAQTISNYYHHLIKERGNLEYCYLYQVSKSASILQN